MIVDADVLARARKGSRDAVIEVLAAQYPSTYRIAHAISGRADVGDGVVAYVTKQSFRVVQKWEDEEAPQRWFRHHALLTLRRAAAKWKPELANDTLVPEEARPDANYVAFVRAIRALPQQQTEAFLLTHGERLDLRNLAVAMDCSTTAASIHLNEADERLRALTGEPFDALVTKLRAAYERLTPSRDLVLSRVSIGLRRRFWPRLLKRIVKLVVLIIVLAGLGWLGWLVWRFALHRGMGVPPMRTAATSSIFVKCSLRDCAWAGRPCHVRVRTCSTGSGTSRCWP